MQTTKDKADRSRTRRPRKKTGAPPSPDGKKANAGARRRDEDAPLPSDGGADGVAVVTPSDVAEGTEARGGPAAKDDDGTPAVADPVTAEGAGTSVADAAALRDDGDRRTAVSLGGRRRFGPLWGAGLLSGAWAVFAGWLVATGVDWSAGVPPPAELGAIVAGLAAPIAIIWLVALVYQRSDPLLERRLAVAQTLDRALAPIDHAEARFDQLIGRMRQDLERMSAVVDLAGERIDRLEDRFKAATADLFSATADAEEKAEAIAGRLQAERARMEALDAALEKRGEGLEAAGERLSERAGAATRLLEEAEHLLAARLETLDALSEEIAARVSGLAELMERQLAGLDERLGDGQAHAATVEREMRAAGERMATLARRSQEETDRILGDLKKAGDALFTTSEEGLARIEVFGDRLSGTRTAIEETVTAGVEQAERAVRDFRDRIAEAVEESEAQNRRLAERMLARTDEAMAAIDARIARLEEVAGTVQERIDERLAAFDAAFREKADALEERAQENVERLSRLAQALADQADMIASSAGKASEAMRAAGERMDERSGNLGQVLDALQRRLEEVSAELERQRDALAETARETGGTIEDAVTSLRERTESLAGAAEEAALRIDRQSTLLKGHVASLGEEAERRAAALREALERLRREGGDLMETLERSSHALGEAAGAFGGERARIVKDTERAAERLTHAAEEVRRMSETLLTSGDAAEERISGIARHFEDAAREIAETAARAEREAANRGKALETEFAQSVARGLREVGQSMDTLNAMFKAEMQELEERVARSLDHSLEAMRRAGRTAREEAQTLARELAETTEKLVARADGFLVRAQEIERRIQAASRDDFLHTSNLLVESLQSAAIDISRLLAVEVPDEVWQQYLKGDRSIFSRRTVRLADRATRRRIAEKFEKDPDFRDAVLKYFRDFESLMEQVMSRDHHAALSVTLISSDMGKLYVLLAQSLKKLS